MKLNPEQLNTSLANELKYRKFLIFGPEESVIETTFTSLTNNVKKNADVDVQQIDYSTAKNDIALVRDGLKSKSLFGGSKLIVVSGISGNISKEFIELCKEPVKNGILILLAGDLGKTSQIRKLAESADDMCATACYKPDAKAIYSLIRSKMQTLGLTFDSNIVNMIAELMPLNSIIIEGELEKLAIYKLDEKNVTEEDVIACFSYSGESSIDDLINAIVSKNLVFKNKQMKRLLHSEINFMLVIRSLVNFFHKLVQVHVIALDKNVIPTHAIQSLTPPLFFKSRDNMILAVNNFSLSQAKIIIGRLIELERRCKSGSVDPSLLLQHFLLRAI
jgi:DNA polymerase-3 subunit delta